MARNAPSVDAYGGGGFRLSGDWHEGSVLILEDVAQPWSATSLKGLTPEDFSAVLSAGSLAVEFVLLGTGPTNGLPPKAVREALAGAGIGLEFMDTPTASRTYNLLTAEGRRLAAALIAI